MPSPTQLRYAADELRRQAGAVGQALAPVAAVMRPDVWRGFAADLLEAELGLGIRALGAVVASLLAAAADLDRRADALQAASHP